MITSFSPHEITLELDRFIIGQKEAKRAVAIALRNRWRRQQLPEQLREEIMPKNILMIGPTGVGKTEISRRLAKLSGAPFVKVEATKFTEIGYVGRDVEQIIRDLVEVASNLVKEKKRLQVQEKAHLQAEENLLTALVGKNASEGTRENFRQQLRNGKLDDKEVEIEISNTNNNSSLDFSSIPGAQMSVINFSEIFDKLGSERKKKVKMLVKDAYKPLINDESEKLLDQDQIVEEALKLAENEGIVFIDEIDKIAARNTANNSAGISREGVQRDLLPLVEGTTVATKYGQIKTDHILFIASGAFHVVKPSDLLPELQGRLPIRVELQALTCDDFYNILTKTEFSLIKQYIALMGTENVDLKFTDEALKELANVSVELNKSVENIGARRLHTVLEKVLEEISFSAPDQKGTVYEIDVNYVKKIVGNLVQNSDLSRFIL